MKFNQFHLFTLLMILLSLCSCRRGSIPLDESNVIQGSGQGTGTTTWKKDKEYILEGFVFVNPAWRNKYRGGE
jgi:predicted small lipoprotein YifL